MCIRGLPEANWGRPDLGTAPRSGSVRNSQLQSKVLTVGMRIFVCARPPLPEASDKFGNPARGYHRSRNMTVGITS
jgi:hypothetical protein